MHTRMTIAVAALICGAGALSACAGEEFGGASGGDDELVVATGSQFPPMEYIDTDSKELTGFDIDLGEAIAEEMSVDLTWEQMDYNQFLSSLRGGRVNMVMGGMGDTKERQAEATFVDYLKTGTQVYTSLESQQKNGIKGLADLCGQTVAASENSNYAIHIEAWSEQNCPNDSQIEVLGTDGSPAARLQLEQGRAVAVAHTTETVSYEMKIEPDTYTMLGEPLNEEYYGIGFAPDDEQRQTDVREALQTLIDDGTYADLVKKWDLQGQEIEEPTVNLEPVDE